MQKNAAGNGLGIDDDASHPMEVDATVSASSSEGNQKPEPVHHQPTPDHSSATPSLNTTTSQEPRANGLVSGPRGGPVPSIVQAEEPPTPPISTEGDHQALTNGGIPWYMETFDPDGATVQEERWTGRDLVRGMSEELSDMGDEELSGLVDLEPINAVQETSNGTLHPADAEQLAAARRKAAAKRKRWRGFR